MIAVSLNHRLTGGYDASEVEDMTGAIETSLLKASAVLMLVSDSIVKPGFNELDTDQLYWAITTALSDLSDITAVLDAYGAADMAKKQAQKNPEL